MADDADRLRAEHLFVEAGKSMAAIAADTGRHRSTIYDWRTEGDWDSKRKELADKIRQAVDELSVPAVAVSAAAHRILSRVEGLAIAASIALSTESENRDRLAALKLIGTFDGWAAIEPAEGDGKPTRLVIGRPNG